MKTATLFKKRKLLIPGISFLTVFAVLLILLKLKGFAPFGEMSLAWADGDLQYLDFFAWLKNVMAGEDTFLYSYYKGMGSNGIGQLGVYLTSPLNLLIVFFDYTKLPAFFDLLVCLKLALAGCFFSVYLECRFDKELLENRAGHLYVYALSLCYALCQYCVAQSSNIMWLDGIYMFPLMMLGIYKVVNNHPDKWMLSVVTGLSIIFNWYSAAMNCFFSIVWFVAEYFLRENRTDKGIKHFLYRGIDYVIYMALGVMLSMVLFLPMALSMTDGSRGGLRWDFLTTFYFVNPLPSIVDKYLPGAISERWSVSLYCGLLPIVGVIGSFVSKKQSVRQKLVYVLMLVFMCLMFYSYPLIGIFSLFRLVGSYWYRYSYLGCFILIFIAANFFVRYVPVKPSRNKAYIIISLLLCLVTIADMAYNAKLLMQTYYANNGFSYGENYTAEKERINQLRDMDGSVYRIHPLSTRNGAQNEGLSVGYMSTQANTSTPAARQVAFLDALGYASEEDTLNVFWQFLPASDAFLGVKYIASPYCATGLESTGLATVNEKDTYLNTYALPFAFAYNKGDTAKSNGSCFKFVDALFEELSNRELPLMEYISFDKAQDGNTITYTMTLPEGNYLYYGNIPFYYDVTNTTVTVNDNTFSYGGYASASVFEISRYAEDGHIAVLLTSDDLNLLQGSEEFYALNLDVLKEATDRLKANEVSDITLDRKKVTVNVNNMDGSDRLYVSLAYDPSWKVYRNGEEINVFLVGDCMYSLPLVDGENSFEFRYSMPSLWIGLGISILGLGILVFLVKRKKTNVKGPTT